MEDENMTEIEQLLSGRPDDIAEVADKMLDRIDMRYKLKRLHNAINIALQKAADGNGFTYMPAGLRYDGTVVSGRMTFVQKGKEAELTTRIARASSCGLSIGDIVVIRSRPDEQFKITGFARVNVKIQRISDGQQFRASPGLFEKVS